MTAYISVYRGVVLFLFGQHEYMKRDVCLLSHTRHLPSQIEHSPSLPFPFHPPLQADVKTLHIEATVRRSNHPVHMQRPSKDLLVSGEQHSLRVSSLPRTSTCAASSSISVGLLFSDEPLQVSVFRAKHLKLIQRAGGGEEEHPDIHRG